MKLDEYDETDEETAVFCWSCGKQLASLDEIAQRVCQECKVLMKKMSEDDTFFCWACGKRLLEMSEVAQGMCHNCKADIIRKIRAPPKKISAVK
jgi:DNA-directed RNA polymerase subunit RPC12/RpoP